MVSIGHTELYVESHGTGDVVMLVAGLGGSATFWQQQVAVLSERYRVVLHDHRGVGRSAPGPLINGVGDLASDLQALMDALDIEDAHLVGHSTGGAIGQHIALNAPQRLKSLVLSASWAGPTALFSETFRLRREVLLKTGVANYMTMGSLLALPSWWLHERFDSAESFLKSRIDGFPGLDVELSRLDAVVAHDLRRRMPEIGTRTTVVCAKDDQLTPPPLSAELASLIPNAVLKQLDSGGHFCPQTATKKYNEVMLSALGESA